MGIGNHELIIHEQDNFEQLSDDFAKAHESEWVEFKQKMYGDEVEQLQNFCENHEEWGNFVADEYNDSQVSYAEMLRDR